MDAAADNKQPNLSRSWSSNNYCNEEVKDNDMNQDQDPEIDESSIDESDYESCKSNIDDKDIQVSDNKFTYDEHIVPIDSNWEASVPMDEEDRDNFELSNINEELGNFEQNDSIKYEESFKLERKNDTIESHKIEKRNQIGINSLPKYEEEKNTNQSNTKIDSITELTNTLNIEQSDKISLLDDNENVKQNDEKIYEIDFTTEEGK